MKTTLLGLFFQLVVLVSFGQSINELRKEKEKTSQQIEYINQLLDETNQKAKSSLNRMSVLDKKIRLQESLISNINHEIGYLDSTIVRSSRNIDSLNADLLEIKNRYAAMIRYARRNQDQNNQLLFLLSAEDFNQAYKRFAYLRQYADYRRKQTEEISVLKEKLSTLVDDLNRKKSDKEVLLTSRKSQSDKFSKQKAEQKEYVSTLQQKEKELRRKLENEQKVAQKLDREIEKSIAEEARKEVARKEEARKNVSAKNSREAVSRPTAEYKILSDDFSMNRGKLPWPLSKGIITDHFGEHPDPVLKRVIRRNAGIDITTNSGARARAVFKGEVTKVLALGGSWAIILRHGSYLTVYSNLASVLVQAGQKVDTRQEIGVVYTDRDDDNKTVLKFQLWHENNKLDPEKWLSL